MLDGELTKINTEHQGALAELSQKMAAECEQKLAQKQIQIDGLHKIIDENAGDKLALARLRNEHAAEISTMNKEFNGVKYAFTDLVWNEFTKL